MTDGVELLLGMFGDRIGGWHGSSILAGRLMAEMEDAVEVDAVGKY